MGARLRPWSTFPWRIVSPQRRFGRRAAGTAEGGSVARCATPPRYARASRAHFHPYAYVTSRRRRTGDEQPEGPHHSDGVSGAYLNRTVGNIANTVDVTLGGKPNDTHFFNGVADEVSISIG